MPERWSAQLTQLVGYSAVLVGLAPLVGAVGWTIPTAGVLGVAGTLAVKSLDRCINRAVGVAADRLAGQGHTDEHRELARAAASAIAAQLTQLADLEAYEPYRHKLRQMAGMARKDWLATPLFPNRC